MLATFIIGLREGLEAALIIGIVATFLRKNGEPRHLRQMWVGVVVAALICLAVGILLGHTSLPQRQQEMLETVVGAIAVVMVTFMVLWMKSHSRNLKRELESSMGEALAVGSALALVSTAFLAVIREGFETAVFLVASVQTTQSGWQSLGGAVIGIAVAVVLGILIYRGGLRINLSRFFRATGVVLVLVAAGLVMSVLRHAHEADWLSIGQQPALDLTAVIRPGSLTEALLTGVLGIAAQPTWIEVLAWALYLVVMLAVVLWPAGRMLTRRQAGRVLALTGASLVAVAAVAFLTVPAPGSPAPVAVALTGTQTAGFDPATGGTTAGQPLTSTPTVAVTQSGSGQILLTLSGSVSGTIELPISGSTTVAGIAASSYQGGTLSVPATGLPTSVTPALLIAANSGRTPIGLTGTDATRPLPAMWTDRFVPEVAIDANGAVLDVRGHFTRTLTVTSTSGSAVTARAIDVQMAPTPVAGAALATAATRHAAAGHRHDVLGEALPAVFGAGGVLLLLMALPRLFGRRRRIASAVPAPTHAVPASPAHNGVREPVTVASVSP